MERVIVRKTEWPRRPVFSFSSVDALAAAWLDGIG